MSRGQKTGDDNTVNNRTGRTGRLLRSKRFTGWGPLSAVLVTLGIYFGAQLLGGLLIGVYGSVAGYSPQKTVELIEDSAVLQFVFVLLVGILTLVLLWWFLKRRKIGLGQIGLGRRPVPSDLSRALATFFLYFLTLFAVLALVGGVFTGIDLDQQQQVGFDGVSGAGSLALVFASLVLLPAVVEEILVRGFLYGGLRSKLRPLVAAVIASLIFAVAHLQFGSGEPLLWVAAIDTFILSMFLIRLREKTGSLWSGMAVHFFKNGVAFISLFILSIG
jgi:hypothetical protein